MPTRSRRLPRSVAPTKAIVRSASARTRPSGDRSSSRRRRIRCVRPVSPASLPRPTSSPSSPSTRLSTACIARRGTERAPSAGTERRPTLYIALAWAVTGRRFARSGRSVSATARSHPSSCMRRRTACLSSSLVGVVSARSAPATRTCQFTSPNRFSSWSGSSAAIWSASSRGIPLGATKPSTTAPSRPPSPAM